MADPARPSGSQFIDVACGLILDRGKILLGLRSPHRAAYPNVWDLFGGHVEDGETIEAALVRELREELDITPSTFKPLVTLTEPNPLRNGKHLYHVYRVTAWSGPGPRLRGAEHTEIGWHTLDEALALDLARPEYRSLLRENAS